jgi:excisionase family DNA binding protein
MRDEVHFAMRHLCRRKETPPVARRGLGERLMTQQASRADAQAWIETIQSRVKRLADLVQRHREVARPGGPDHQREIDEARWQIVAAVQQMPALQENPTAERRDDPIFTPDELAERWGISKQQVKRLVASGRLRCFRVGSLYRFTTAAVLEFERTQQQGR